MKLFFQKKITLLFAFVITLSSCKTTTTKTIRMKNYSTQKIIQKYQEEEFNAETLSAKLKVKYDDGKIAQNVSVKLRMEKDKVIWMSASFLGFPVGKIKITPHEVAFYEKIKGTYFQGNFGLLSDFLGTKVDFEQVQNILLGQSLFQLDSENIESKINEQSYLLYPKPQSELYDIYIWMNPVYYKLDSQQVISGPQDNLKIDYDAYQKIDHEFLPKDVSIKAHHKQKKTLVNMEYKQIELNKALSFPFDIPSGYKKITIK